MKNKEKCSICGSRFGFFRRRHKCMFCGKIICSKCLKRLPDLDYLEIDPFKAPGEKCCKACYELHVAQIVDKYNRAVDEYTSIKTILKTYEGKKQYKNDCPMPMILTSCYYNKDEVLKALKITAAFLGCDIVYDVEYKRDVLRDENFIYYLWSARGIPARQNDS